MGVGCRVPGAGRNQNPTPDTRYPIPDTGTLFSYQLNRATSWITRLEFSCTPVMR